MPRFAQPSGKGQGRDQQTLAAQDAHPIVRDHDVLPVGQGMFDEGGRDRVAPELQRPDMGRSRRPAGRRRRGRLAASTPLGEGEELAECLARFISNETELALDLQAQFHAVEAVQAELIEPYRWPHFSVG